MVLDLTGAVQAARLGGAREALACRLVSVESVVPPLGAAWALPVCWGQACNDAESWGCLSPSQGQGSPVLLGSTSQKWWLSSAVGLPRGCESCVGSEQQVKERNTGNSFWVTGSGAGTAA